MSANPSVARGLLRTALVFVTHKILYFNAPNTQYTIYYIVWYIYIYIIYVSSEKGRLVLDLWLYMLVCRYLVSFNVPIKGIDRHDVAAYTGDATWPVYTTHPYYPLVHFRSRQYSVLILYQIIIHTCVMCVCVCVCVSFAVIYFPFQPFAIQYWNIRIVYLIYLIYR